MNKLALIIPVMFIIGCASKKIIDPCVAKKKICLTECKVKYSEGLKYNACKTKCYAEFSGCKIKEKAKEIIKD